jgi:hypothetical protein
MPGLSFIWMNWVVSNCWRVSQRYAFRTRSGRRHGDIGLIVRAIRRGTRTVSEVKTLLEQIPTRSTLHISRSLLAEIIRSLPER